MKAIVVQNPNDYGMQERPIPEIGRDEVLIKIYSVGMCGTDLEILSTDMQYYKTGRAKLPIIPGHEWSGVIEKMGAEVRGFEVGDHVTGECTVACGHCKYCQRGLPNICENRTETGVMNRDGGYAQYIAFPVTALHKVNGMSFNEAALIEPSGIAMQAVQRADIRPSDRVLVMGPGPIGLLAAQIAKRVYAAKQVLLSGTRDERLIRAKDYTDAIINVNRQDLAKEVMELTGGLGVDVVIIAAGAASALTDCEKIMAPAGRISICAFFGSVAAPCNWDFISTNQIEIRGSLGGPAIWPFVIECIESGKLDVKNIISHELPLESSEDFQNALDLMVQRKDGACKIILHPNGPVSE